MARELDLEALDALEQTETPQEEAGQSVEIAVVTSVRRAGAGPGLTVTKRTLTFKDGRLVDPGKAYQVRIDAASAFD